MKLKKFGFGVEEANDPKAKSDQTRRHHRDPLAVGHRGPQFSALVIHLLWLRYVGEW
jgi:hypothetical protein